MVTHLLTLIETSGRNEFITRHLIDVEDRQMVKYHFHRTMKDFGYGQQYGGAKHLVQRDGHAVEIHEIQELSQMEADVLSDFLPKWTKV